MFLVVVKVFDAVATSVAQTANDSKVDLCVCARAMRQTIAATVAMNKTFK